MLTMGKPIQPKSIRPVGSLEELFGEKIRANYEMMQGHIDPTDILHFLSAPPEMYLVETGMTILVNQQNETKIQRLEINLVNSVLNRILSSGQFALTYQDRVFVENVLKKLGVTDVREWMRQVRMIKEETRNVRELLSLYESGQDAVHLLWEYRREYGERQKAAETQGETKESETTGSLAVAVLKRLQTKKICREVGEHVSLIIGGRTTIDRQELSFGEQSIAASYLTLNDYRSQFFESQSLMFDQNSQYEMWDIRHTDRQDVQTVNRLLHTALLNAVRQLFHIRYAELTRYTGRYHTFMDALHVSVRNTFQRFAQFPAGRFTVVRERDARQRTLRYFERQEIDSLRELFATSAKTTVQTVRDRKTALTARDRTSVLETQRLSLNRDILRQEQAQSREQSPQEAEMLRTEREKEIISQLERINRQNVERMERLAEYTRQTEEVGERHIDWERTMTNTVKVLGGEEPDMPVYQEREMPHRAETMRETEKLREILGEETVRMLETVRGYQEDPGRYPHVTASKGQAADLLLRDIAAAGEARDAVLEAEPEMAVYDGKRRAKQEAAPPAFPGTIPGALPGERRAAGTEKGTEQTVELFHRQNAQTISEETLRELMQNRKKDVLAQHTDVRETFREEAKMTEIVQSKVNEMKVRQDEEIARMISQNVKRQLDTLSEKVYGKLERRMDAERRRRGL